MPLNSFFDNNQHYLKEMATRIKQFVDHNHDLMQPQTELIMSQAVEHLVIAYLYTSFIDRYLSGADSENQLQAHVAKELANFSQIDCLQVKV